MTCGNARTNGAGPHSSSESRGWRPSGAPLQGGLSRWGGGQRAGWRRAHKRTIQKQRWQAPPATGGGRCLAAATGQASSGPACAAWSCTQCGGKESRQRRLSGRPMCLFQPDGRLARCDQLGAGPRALQHVHHLLGAWRAQALTSIVCVARAPRPGGRPSAAHRPADRTGKHAVMYTPRARRPTAWGTHPPAPAYTAASPMASTVLLPRRKRVPAHGAAAHAAPQRGGAHPGA